MSRSRRRVYAAYRWHVPPSIVVALGVLIPTTALAAGTAADVHAARATAMATSVTAMIDDASAVFYNPAGIAQGRRVDVMVGDTLIVPRLSFKSSTTGNSASTSGVVPPVHMYATGGLTDSLSLGVGLFSLYGLRVQWPQGWEGRSIAVSSSLSTYYVNPTVAYRMGPVRIGAGFQLVRATLDLQRKIRFGDQEGSSELGGAAWGYGANIGVQVEAIRQYLSFGLHYRSAVKLDFDGDAHFQGIPLSLAATIHDQRVSTSLTQPDTLAFGVASRVVPELVLELDVGWFGWKKVRSIDINFPDDHSGTLSSSQRKDWSNTVNVHLGGEAAIADQWRLRAGILYDPSPSPAATLTPETPDADRLNLALGGGYLHESGFRLDLAYQLLFLFKKPSTAPQLPGDYGGLVHLVGITLGYRTPVAQSVKQ